MAAFDRALALGADGVELDVRLSKDGEVVVVHDDDLARTTDRRGPIAGLTADELARVDAGARFEQAGGTPFRGQGFGIPRLADVLAHLPALPFIIELKGADPAIAYASVEVVRRAGALDRVCFGGFADRVLRAARQAGPDVCTSAARNEIRWALYCSYVRWPVGPRAYRAFQVPETSGTTRVVSPRFLQAAKGDGRLVQVWTVNEPADMQRLADWGIDGWITDRPDLAREVAGSRRRPENGDGMLFPR